jgi:hypothetical protein
MSSKVCCVCGVEKDVCHFNKLRDKSVQEHPEHSSICRTCYRGYPWLIKEEKTEKYCASCGMKLPITEFSKKGKTKLGFTQYKSWCKKCRRVKETHFPIPPLKSIMAHAKYRAKKNGLDFGLTLEYLLELNDKQHGLCAISGISLNWESGKRPFDRASIDRIDSSKGYTLDNTQLVLDSVNRAKSDLPQEQFLELCKLIVNYNNL